MITGILIGCLQNRKTILLCLVVCSDQNGVIVPNADVVLKINFNLNEPDKTVIKTNARKEAISEILEAWLSCQVGQGKDSREPNRKDEYEIVIKLDLSDDTFFTNSDTGNKSLTCGLVMNVFNRLDQITVTTLS